MMWAKPTLSHGEAQHGKGLAHSHTVSPGQPGAPRMGRLLHGRSWACNANEPLPSKSRVQMWVGHGPYSSKGSPLVLEGGVLAGLLSSVFGVFKEA